MLILGIDDAGRGPVIGPMVLAGCLIDDTVESELKNLGVKDSKQLTQKRREFLSEKIKGLAETFEIVLAHPEEIDRKNHDGINLNALEAIKMAEVINRINKGFSRIKVIIDCPSVSIEKWKDYLKTKINNLSNLEIVCEHKADVNHISVSAASILAKCVREIEMGKLKEQYGSEIGSGYCSDPLTTKFLQKHAQTYGDKGIFRKTWSTWKDVCSMAEQQKLI
ncbi:MAG: ribonuclease HII [Candidatus Nanoarchaeia archaeon]|nr:ribonuclease HII [Candidatus Nanoarchaeia archaeon]MDD5357726.1 ribonuclease HII [Candidatus Nanoarchaeia archaeon]MDD5588645.1 ribonuclease HII [Candidatus Nanoarchaeia archaeon]